MTRKNVFTKALAVAGLSLGLAAGTSTAEAAVTFNGININGIVLNGILLNGLHFNGIHLNDLRTTGLCGQNDKRNDLVALASRPIAIGGKAGGHASGCGGKTATTPDRVNKAKMPVLKR